MQAKPDVKADTAKPKNGQHASIGKGAAGAAAMEEDEDDEDDEDDEVRVAGTAAQGLSRETVGYTQQGAGASPTVIEVGRGIGGNELAVDQSCDDAGRRGRCGRR